MFACNQGNKRSRCQQNGSLVTHYHTLQVVPWAEESVIRAAYRALIRLYHPDTNQDPEAQLRVREINAAFAVLSDPMKRAAYDEFPTLSEEPDVQAPASVATDRRRRWSARGTGVASVGMAVIVLSLTVATWPQLGSRPARRDPNKEAKAGRIPPPPESLPKRNSIEMPPHGIPAASAVSNRILVLPKARTRDVIEDPLNDSATTISKRDIATASPKPNPQKAMANQIAAENVIPKAASVAQASNVDARTPAAAGCSGAASKVGAGECGDDRQVQVERIAAGFFKQSMNHADAQKQQLLLSARTRAVFSRTLCHSSECVTQTYLRQMRDTTDIMAGRIPTP